MNKNNNKPVLVFLFVFFFVTSTSVILGIIQQEIKMAEPYKYTRIYSDAEGESHFEDVRIPFKLMSTKRFTEIYVLEDLQWRLAARQATLIE